MDLEKYRKTITQSRIDEGIIDDIETTTKKYFDSTKAKVSEIYKRAKTFIVNLLLDLRSFFKKVNTRIQNSLQGEPKEIPLITQGERKHLIKFILENLESVEMSQQFTEATEYGDVNEKSHLAANLGFLFEYLWVYTIARMKKLPILKREKSGKPGGAYSLFEGHNQYEVFFGDIINEADLDKYKIDEIATLIGTAQAKNTIAAFRDFYLSQREIVRKQVLQKSKDDINVKVYSRIFENEEEIQDIILKSIGTLDNVIAVAHVGGYTSPFFKADFSLIYAGEDGAELEGKEHFSLKLYAGDMIKSATIGAYSLFYLIKKGMKSFYTDKSSKTVEKFSTIDMKSMQDEMIDFYNEENRRKKEKLYRSAAYVKLQKRVLGDWIKELFENNYPLKRIKSILSLYLHGAEKSKFFAFIKLDDGRVRRAEPLIDHPGLKGLRYEVNSGSSMHPESITIYGKFSKSASEEISQYYTDMANNEYSVMTVKVEETRKAGWTPINQPAEFKGQIKFDVRVMPYEYYYEDEEE